ncbi:hypothetical protein ACFL0L_05345 [Patescibacteria group bacterium]
MALSNNNVPKVEVVTKNKTILGLTLGMVGAALAGFGMIMLMSTQITNEVPTTTLVVNAGPLMVQDVDNAIITSSDFEMASASMWGYTGEVTDFYFASAGTSKEDFQDGSQAPQPFPFYIMTSEIHPEMAITLEMYPPSEVLETKMLCLPASQSGTVPNISFLNRILGINEAHAQVDLNPIKYYFDIAGNAYYDVNLTQLTYLRIAGWKSYAFPRYLFRYNDNEDFYLSLCYYSLLLNTLSKRCKVTSIKNSPGYQTSFPELVLTYFIN